jgi:SAM-dependent methyltransferase
MHATEPEPHRAKQPAATPPARGAAAPLSPRPRPPATPAGARVEANEAAGEPDELLVTGADGRPVKFRRAWYRFALQLLPQTRGPWVDLGCGNGEFVQLGKQLGLAGFGVDIAHGNVAMARQLGHEGVVANLERGLPFRDGSLSGISMIELLEHVFEAERLLRECRRVLRPGGWLVLTTPNVASARYRLRALMGHPPKQEGYHRRFFTRELLTSLVEEAGFTIDGRASYGSSALLSRVARLRLGKPKYKVRFLVPSALEAVFAGHFVWRLRRA